eukprot:6511930-Alexandrium_andersonii.AAC.1
MLSPSWRSSSGVSRQRRRGQHFLVLSTLRAVPVEALLVMNVYQLEAHEVTAHAQVAGNVLGAGALHLDA